MSRDEAETGVGGREGSQRHMRKILWDMNTFIILIIVLVSWVYSYAKMYQIVYFKDAQFIASQLYLNIAVKNP